MPTGRTAYLTCLGTFMPYPDSRSAVVYVQGGSTKLPDISGTALAICALCAKPRLLWGCLAGFWRLAAMGRQLIGFQQVGNQSYASSNDNLESPPNIICHERSALILLSLTRRTLRASS